MPVTAIKEEALKDLHFQVPESMFNDFLSAFPERGERRVVLMQFIKEEIKLQSLKDYFTSLVGKQVLMQRLQGTGDKDDV
jgi:hypothetical protein